MSVLSAIKRPFLTNSYAAQVLNLHPSAYWRLNETAGVAEDLSINGNNGTLEGGITLGNPGPMVFDEASRCMGFNGTTGIIKTGTNGLPVINGAQTVMAWINMSRYSNPGGYATDVLDQIDLAETGNQFRLTPSGDLQLAAYGGESILESSIAEPLRSWHLIGWSWDDTTHALWLDAKIIASNTTAPSQSGTPTICYLGNYGTGSGDVEWFRGNMAEAAIFGYALSVTQWQTLMTAAKTGGLLLWLYGYKRTSLLDTC